MVDSLPEATYHDIVKLVVMLHGDDCSEAWQRLAEVFLHADEALSRLKDELCLQAA